MSYIYLLLAILFEVIGTTSMKFSEGFSKSLPSILVFVFYGLSVIGLVMALRNLDLSYTYAVWAGLGTASIATIGFLWFNESMTVIKLISLGLIVAGVVGLNLQGEAG